jgi:plastocyanin
LRKIKTYLIISTLLLLVIPVNSVGHTSDAVTREIKIKNFAFVPEVLNIEIGDSVVFTWENAAVGHNVAQVSNSKDTGYISGFKSGAPQNGPASWTLPDSFTQENVTLFYICEPHVLTHNMKGKIIVGAGSDEVEAAGANLKVILGIFLAAGIFSVVAVIILQKKNKAT